MEINVPTIKIENNDPDFEARLGRFTGSMIKDLMSCDRSVSKKQWGDPEKTIGLGATAIKYIYAKARERQKNKYIKSYGGRAASFGKNMEETVFEMVKADYPELELMPNNDFIEIIPGIIGATPDFKGLGVAGEIKCATSWDTEFARIGEDVHEKHQDFWQIQTEMMALNVKECLYIVAEPPADIMEPIIDGYTPVSVQASEIHQKAILDRARLGNMAIELFIKGMPFYEAIRTASTEVEL